MAHLSDKKNQITNPTVSVTPKAEKSILSGHPWVYGEEITSCIGKPEDGGIADVLAPDGTFLGRGFYNSASKIRIRLLTRKPGTRIDTSFFKERLADAIAYRRHVMGSDFSCCRLVFGEADRLPGLTVDRFSHVLSVQITCLGLERYKDLIYSTLLALLREEEPKIDCIVERNDLALRDKEGLPRTKGIVWGTGDGIARICENGLLFDVDCINGQKTGWFLDQKYNRAAAARLAHGTDVLDCFTHTGAFAINCAAAGANSVTAVDVSAEALESAAHNAELNGLNINFVKNDVFDLLTDMNAHGERGKYNYIILDPPAFTKSSDTVGAATAGYREINSLAMRLLPKGGYLATCSCSHFMTDKLFYRAVGLAAADAGVSLQQIEQRKQASDHPILVGVPETEYLKFYLFRVI